MATGRPTKLNSTSQNQLVKLIKTGVTVDDACAYVGIHRDSFYEWMRRGEAGDELYADFSDAIHRARNSAKVAAIETLRNAMSPYKTTTTTTETFIETRLDRHGNPYEYKRVKESKAVTVYAGDWRAAVEYLKRRFFDEWGDRQKNDDWRSDAIALIKRGEVTYDAIAEAFNDHSLAAELFAAAGVTVQVGAGEADQPE